MGHSFCFTGFSGLGLRESSLKAETLNWQEELIDSLDNRSLFVTD